MVTGKPYARACLAHQAASRGQRAGGDVVVDREKAIADGVLSSSPSRRMPSMKARIKPSPLSEM